MHLRREGIFLLFLIIYWKLQGEPTDGGARGLLLALCSDSLLAVFGDWIQSQPYARPFIVLTSVLSLQPRSQLLTDTLICPEQLSFDPLTLSFHCLLPVTIFHPWFYHQIIRAMRDPSCQHLGRRWCYGCFTWHLAPKKCLVQVHDSLDLCL